MDLMGAALGASFAIGLAAIALGLRGTSTPPAHQPSARPRQGDERLVKLAAAISAAVVAQGITGWPVAAAVLALAAWKLPEVLRRRRTETDEVARTEAVAAWTELLRDTLAAAAGLEEAVAATARAAPEAIRTEVGRLAGRLEREPLVPSLQRFADEVTNPAADLVVAALVTAARREARDLVPLLGALAASARAEAEMRLRVHVSRARVRTAARVITVTLVLFAGGLIVFNRAYLAPYSTVEGQLVLLIVVAIFASGWTLLHRMARIEGPPRFFGTEQPDSERSQA
jgi:tight adherence protein B